MLGYRLSFPLPDCPEWDDGAARATVVRFGEYLEKLVNMGGEGVQQGRMDVLSASKVVLRVLEEKFRRRVARLEPKRRGVVGALWAVATGQGQGEGERVATGTRTGCPMLDGSMEAYFPVWDETFAVGRGVGGQHQGGVVGVGMDGTGMGMMGGIGVGTGEEMSYGNDLWATISMGWAQDGGVPPGDDGNGGPGVFGAPLM